MTQLAQGAPSEGQFPVAYSLHDPVFYAAFFGEPCMTDGCVWFFDGMDARVVGLDSNLLSIEGERLEALASAIRRECEPASLSIETPVLLSLRKALPGFTRQIVARPSKYDCELIVDPKDYRERASVRHSVHRARRLGLKCLVRVGESTSMTVAHWRMLKAHIDSFETSSFYNSEFLVAVTKLLADPCTTQLEVYAGGELLGIALLREASSLAILHYMVVLEERRTSVADLIYQTAIERAGRAGLQLSLGTCPTRGLLEYKLKWATGRHIRVPGHLELSWMRGDAPQSTDYMWTTTFLRRLNRRGMAIR